MSWYSALLDGFLKIQIHPEEENFSTSEPRIWMYPPDKTIPTNDNFFLRSNIHAVIVSSIEKSVDIRPPSPFSRHSRKSFASVYVYKHSSVRNDSKHNTLDQRTSVMEFSFSRMVLEKHNEIFVSRPKASGKTFALIPKS